MRKAEYEITQPFTRPNFRISYQSKHLKTYSIVCCGYSEFFNLAYFPARSSRHKGPKMCGKLKSFSLVPSLGIDNKSEAIA
jgi:hypothetical protein